MSKDTNSTNYPPKPPIGYYNMVFISHGSTIDKYF
jgi:hypothetical protein